jgi:hypothetical protein
MCSKVYRVQGCLLYASSVSPSESLWRDTYSTVYRGQEVFSRLNLNLLQSLRTDICCTVYRGQGVLFQASSYMPSELSRRDNCSTVTVHREEGRLL